MGIINIFFKHRTVQAAIIIYLILDEDKQEGLIKAGKRSFSHARTKKKLKKKRDIKNLFFFLGSNF